MTRPGGAGWAAVRGMEGIESTEEKGSLAYGILAMFLGVCLVYAALFGTGFFLYGQMTYALLATAITVVTAWLIYKFVDRV